MFVRVTQSAVDLVEPEDNRRFKVVVDVPRGARESVLQQFQKIVVFDGAEEAWVSIDALRNWQPMADAAGWQSSLDEMFAVARRFGWVDEARGAVKAHVEWPR